MATWLLAMVIVGGLAIAVGVALWRLALFAFKAHLPPSRRIGPMAKAAAFGIGPDRPLLAVRAEAVSATSVVPQHEPDAGSSEHGRPHEQPGEGHHAGDGNRVQTEVR